jgi:hypothetical protein
MRVIANVNSQLALSKNIANLQTPYLTKVRERKKERDRYEIAFIHMIY